MIGISVVALMVQVETAAIAQADTANALMRAARRAEAAFERIARQRAPLTFASWGGPCDEIVGRFCLTYDTSDLPAAPPEPSPVVHARREAIEALRRAFSYAPESLEVTGPLVRYLVEDERAPEAVSAARAFLALSNDTTWGALLLGFALHAAADDTAAARWLDEGVGRLDERERERIEDVSWLLAHDEHGIYRRLDAEGRTAYREALWTLADPLYLTPGNERRNAHLSRHVWSRILSRAPVVTDAVRWGRDLEQLTVRYGTPRSRMRAMGSRLGESSMIERYDPEQLAYTPEQMRRRGVPPPPLPGETWPLANPRARSGFAPETIRRIIPLDHQLSRFPERGEVVLRVDAAFAVDSGAVAVRDSVGTAARPVIGGLFLLDSLYSQVHGEVRDEALTAGDTAHMVFTATVPPGHYVYSAEAFEPESRYAARARYAVEADVGRGVRLSDIVVARPFGADSLPRSRDDAALQPRTTLVVTASETLGLYAEVHGLAAGADGRARFRVEITRRSADRTSLPAEIVAWLGRRLGIGGRESAPRVAWTAEGEPDGANAIAIDLSAPGASPGVYVLELAVTDLVSGERRETRRPIRVR